ncbi:MAG: TrmH family RNA methyltransferase [Myxococcales bacterium]|nr:TrmH family RNA methyltransferase [Myxococcales bacterium]MDH3483292.1 TrmH family RNA methyltransferase [Myxococcales bacterium]MDH3726798.1 TrmH family RNA methyltransferase [Myxococcales bacterium]
MAQVPPFEMPRSEIRSELDRIRHPFRVAIDRAKNPFNIGSIIRTAHSFLAKEIILIGTEPWYERAAMGMQRYENIVELPTERTFLDAAEKEGWKLVAFEKDHAQVGLWEVELCEDAVLVFGNEDDGCSPTILEAAEQVVAIPMFGINHSYPISVAAGIAMAEWARQHYENGRSV